MARRCDAPDKLETKGLTIKQIQEYQKVLWSSVNAVFILWRNNYRFASEAVASRSSQKDEVVQRDEGRPARGESLRSPQGCARIPRQRSSPMAIVRKLKKSLVEYFPPPDADVHGVQEQGDKGDCRRSYPYPTSSLKTRSAVPDNFPCRAGGLWR